MDGQQDPDADLMLRTQAGDLDAFGVLVDKYKGPVLNMATRMLLDPTEAEDLAQNVFVQVYKSAGRYRPASKFSTWLFTIARNLCLNEIRRRGRHPSQSLEKLTNPQESEGSMEAQLADPSATFPTEALLQSELTRKVSEAMAELPENQRTALTLWQQEELSYEEIAEILQVSVSAVKSLIHRARETLKARIKPYLRTGAWTNNQEDEPQL